MWTDSCEEERGEEGRRRKEGREERKGGRRGGEEGREERNGRMEQQVQTASLCIYLAYQEGQ